VKRIHVRFGAAAASLRAAFAHPALALDVQGRPAFRRSFPEADGPGGPSGLLAHRFTREKADGTDLVWRDRYRRVLDKVSKKEYAVGSGPPGWELARRPNAEAVRVVGVRPGPWLLALKATAYPGDPAAALAASTYPRTLSVSFWNARPQAAKVSWPILDASGRDAIATRTVVTGCRGSAGTTSST